MEEIRGDQKPKGARTSHEEKQSWYQTSSRTG